VDHELIVPSAAELEEMSRTLLQIEWRQYRAPFLSLERLGDETMTNGAATISFCNRWCAETRNDRRRSGRPPAATSMTSSRRGRRLGWAWASARSSAGGGTKENGLGRGYGWRWGRGRSGGGAQARYRRPGEAAVAGAGRERQLLGFGRQDRRRGYFANKLDRVYT
jgi:hypothetical protein